ncbi:MAG: SpoIIE family protein phosphatase [Acidobacteria bacterium]|nr:SpoIIE family protein phosphatase [Acidobacteriota bacterium]
MNELIITHADGTIRRLRLEDKPLTLGRGPTCELSFPDDPGLSRRHLTFELDGGKWKVRDLGSTNGTLFNGVALTSQQTLRPGDKVGASQITLEYSEGKPVSSPRTVVFDPGKVDEYSSGTVSVSLEQLLATKPPTDPNTGEPKQWVTPLQALMRVGRELAQRRKLEELFPVILELSLEAVNAERGVLLVLEGDELVLKASRGGEFRISTVIRDRVMNDRQSILIQSVAEVPDLNKRKSIVLQGVRSLMAVPLQTDEQSIGLLYVDSQNFLRRFGQDDLNLLTVMSNVAAIRIERERLALIEQAQRVQAAELQQAAEIQQRHLPVASPNWRGLEIVARHSACRGVGGDYYGYFHFADGRYGFVLGDVAGKGMPAALMMMSLHARVHAMAEATSSVCEFVGKLNRSMHPTCAPNRFVTMFVGAFDPATGELTYTSAGHNPSLLIRANGSVQELGEGGMFVGLMSHLTYTEHKVSLHEGDTLVMYSDGITEQENRAGEEFGMGRLTGMTASRATLPLLETADTVLRAVSDWAQGEPASDDQTVMIVRRCSG